MHLNNKQLITKQKDNFMQNNWKSSTFHHHKSFVILGLNQRLLILWTFFFVDFSKPQIICHE